MITSKWINVIVIAVMVLAVTAISAAAFVYADSYDPGISYAYEEQLFNTEEIITVEIQIEEDQWEELLETAVSETYYRCDVTVNGTVFTNVGIRAKGNTSLSSVAASDSDRYSLKLEFDHYVEGQTCFGLDKLILNNNYADATMKKEAVTYDMFAFLGADASLYNYASISVNGEYWGVYLALEAVEESFALRNYGTNYGSLYKPETMDMGGGMADGDGRQEDRKESPFGNQEETQGQEMPGEFPEGLTPPSGEGVPEGEEMPEGEPPQQEEGFPGELPEGLEAERGSFGGMGNGSGASLNYIDDELDSYSAIWDSEVFDTDKKDHKRVVKALKNISAGTNLEESMDIDNLLRYMAVQTFVVNLDSLSGNMAHNYYLYEKDGQLNLIPWDYNLAFGGFQSSDASSVVNFPIDTPFSGVDTEDRQFFMALLEQEEHREQYYEYLTRLTEEYVYGGGLEAFYTRTDGLIDALVETDPTSFYTYEEYTEASGLLYQLIRLRADSIRGQVEGSIPSSSQEQEGQEELLIDASEIDLSVLGSMFGGQEGGRKDAAREAATAERQERPEDSRKPERSEPGTGSAAEPHNGSETGAAALLGGCLLWMAAGILAVSRYRRR